MQVNVNAAVLALGIAIGAAGAAWVNPAPAFSKELPVESSQSPVNGGELATLQRKWVGRPAWFTGDEFYKEPSDWPTKGFPVRTYCKVEVLEIVPETLFDGRDGFAVKVRHVDGPVGWLVVRSPSYGLIHELAQHDVRKVLGYSDRAWRDIWGGKVRVGMDEFQVRLAWGVAARKNRTTTTSGVNEQWVYPKRGYVYFTNGKVTAVQEESTR